jgi:putative ABC transport system substrate-binding protein
LTYSFIDKVTALAARTGKPTVGVYPEWGRAGLLMSYGPDLVNGSRRAGVYAGKILAGAKPADLPVTFAINLKTAKALGIEVPRPCSRSPTR